MMRRFAPALTASFLLFACAEGDKTPPPADGVPLGGAAGKAGAAGKSGAAGKAGSNASGAGGTNGGTGGSGGAAEGGKAGTGGAEAGQGGDAGAAGGGAAGGASGQSGAGGQGGAGAAGATGGTAGAAGAAGANGGAAGTTSGNAGTAGNAGGTAGSGGAAAGSAGSAGGIAGGAGSGGIAGAAGSGGAAGGAGAAGAGGSGTPTGLLAVALSASGQLVPAKLDGFTWKTGTTTETAVGLPAMAAAGAEGVVTYRTASGALRYGRLNASLGLDAGEIASVSKNGPTLAPWGDGVRVAFTDASDGLLTALYASGAGFGAVSKLTSDVPGSTSLAAPATGKYFNVESSVHAGTNEGLYRSLIGGKSEPIMAAGVRKDVAPVISFSNVGFTYVFFVRNTDSQLYVSECGAFSCSLPTFVAQNAFTDRSPSVARLVGGGLIVVWHGKDNQGIYFARVNGGVADWGKPGLIVQEGAAVASSPVAVATETGIAEILFVRGGVATRARVDASSVTVSAAFGTGLSEIAGAYLPP